MNQNQHIQTVLYKQSSKSRSHYRVRLNASVDCVRYLLQQGLAFRGHDELESYTNQGNLLELLRFLADHNDDIKDVTLENAQKNLKLTSPDVQKDIVFAIDAETINAIIQDIGDSLFSILVDESRDVSMKEQMTIVLRYVNKNGQVVERFLGIEHVLSTTVISLKASTDKLFSKHRLSLLRLRWQGYDGASNMRGEFDGLKAIILNENPSAFYVHCFAHQLQLALVAVSKKEAEISSLLSLVTRVVNVIGVSAKCCEVLQLKQAAILGEPIKNNDIVIGRGQNQKTSLKRVGDTRWGSHYVTLMQMIHMFPAICEVLEFIFDDTSGYDHRGEAKTLLAVMHSIRICLYSTSYEDYSRYYH